MVLTKTEIERRAWGAGEWDEGVNQQNEVTFVSSEFEVLYSYVCILTGWLKKKRKTETRKKGY